METEVLPFRKPDHKTVSEGLDAAKRLTQTVESRRILDAVRETLSWHDANMHGDELRRQIREIVFEEVRAATALLAAREDRLAKQLAETINQAIDAHEQAHHERETTDAR